VFKGRNMHRLKKRAGLILLTVFGGVLLLVYLGSHPPWFERQEQGTADSLDEVECASVFGEHRPRGATDIRYSSVSGFRVVSVLMRMRLSAADYADFLSRYGARMGPAKVQRSERFFRDSWWNPPLGRKMTVWQYGGTTISCCYDPEHLQMYYSLSN
jgi:hypothetical protein